VITYFPAIYPDELIYSWFCRYYVHSGYLTQMAALRELFCINMNSTGKESDGNLRPEVIDRFEQMYTMTELIVNHTMYPQYARFLASEEKKTALKYLCYRPCDIDRLFSGHSCKKKEQFIRFCPQCVKEDRENYGETYWHRKHQIHTMPLCSKYRCRLVDSMVSVDNEQTHMLFPAEEYVYEAEMKPVENETEIRYAAYLEAVFDAPMDLENDIPARSILYHRMKETETLKPSERNPYTKIFAGEMYEFFENMELCSTASAYQIHKVLMWELLDFSVICQTAFFLGIKPEELLLPAFEQGISKEQNNGYMEDKTLIDQKEYDKVIATVLDQVARSIYDGTVNKNGRPERVTKRLVCREINLLEHQLDNMPQCRKILKRYKETYPESRARKIIWAYQKLKEGNRYVCWSDIKELSGVKKKSIPAVIPYLKKYADEETVQHITTLLE